jgi:alkylhydroperoxidase family enzyme
VRRNDREKPARLASPRVPPLDDSECREEQRELLDRARVGGEVINIFRTLVRHPKLLKRWTVFGNHVLNKSTLSPREREILILRIGWLCHSEYEWGQHVVIGKACGLTEDDLARIQDGPHAAGLDPFESLLLRATDELYTDAMISDTTWNQLAERYDTQQLFDVIFTVGQYNLVSMALNSLGVPLDEGLRGFARRAEPGL